MNAEKAKQLTVAPQGGLGNRMRVIRSAYAVALKGVRVDVAFAENDDCRCAFEDVFQPLKAPSDNFVVRRAKWIDSPSSRRNFYLPFKLRSLVFDYQSENFNASGKEDIYKIFSENDDVFLSTCFEFAGYEMPMREIFKPSAEVAEAANDLAKRFSSYKVGFHVRRTDNVAAAKASPLSLFLSAAHKELETNPHATFFLATDSLDVRSEFVKEFGDRVVYSAGPLSRSSREGMIAAAADMFALSCCNVIYGSYYSSFSEIAAELGNKKANILKL